MTGCLGLGHPGLGLNLPQSNKFPRVREKKNKKKTKKNLRMLPTLFPLSFKLETFHLLDEGNNYYNTETPELGHLCDTIDF